MGFGFGRLGFASGLRFGFGTTSVSKFGGIGGAVLTAVFGKGPGGCAACLGDFRVIDLSGALSGDLRGFGFLCSGSLANSS
ncbi:MAG: hypothetical protein VX809_04830, partial [Pseudomonadota bacterium]|nr:hypothetical protein [Pseudomonadota bacterium]